MTGTLISIFLLAVAGVGGKMPEDSTAEYTALVQRVQAGQLDVDYRELRLSCLHAKSCNARGDATQTRAMMRALNDRDYPTAAKNCEALVQQGFVNIEAHIACAEAYKAMGDAAKAQLHHDVASGLIRSILGSGDGKTPQTAWEVIDTGEEYVVVSVLGYPRFPFSQALVSEGKHSYDVLTVKDPKTNQNVKLYFNIDAFFPEAGF